MPEPIALGDDIDRWSHAANVFERLTDQARRVVVFAQDEARLLRHNYIGTEHLLLGLIRGEDSVAARTLAHGGATLAAARAEVERVIGRGGSAPSGHIPFTPRAKRVLELALRDDRRSDAASEPGPTATGRGLRPRLRKSGVGGPADNIGPAQLLLDLIGEGEGIGLQVLRRLRVDLSDMEQAVRSALERAQVGQEMTGAGKVPNQPVGIMSATEPILRCPGCNFELRLVAAPRELRVRMERAGDPRFRISVAIGDGPERLAHECGAR